MCNPKMCKDAPNTESTRKNLKERRSKRKLIIAALGLTKAGKTSFITALVKQIGKIISLFLGDNNRTKVTVDYHFVSWVSPEQQDLMIEDIQFRLSAIARSSDFSSTQVFNEEVEKNPIYIILKLQTIEDSENFEEKLAEMLKSFTKNITPKDLAKILNTEGIDDYIKKITILVEATQDFANILEELEIDLYMRDTRGLMDLALQKQDDGTKITNRAISELIDEISETNINIIAELNSISSAQQLSLIKKALNFVLYRGFTDIYATIQNYVIVPRESARSAIYNTMNLGVRTNIPLETAVAFILDDFCNTLNSSDVNKLFTN